MRRGWPCKFKNVFSDRICSRVRTVHGEIVLKSWLSFIIVTGVSRQTGAYMEQVWETIERSRLFLCILYNSFFFWLNSLVVASELNF